MPPDRVLIDTNIAIYLTKENGWSRLFRPLVEGKIVAISFVTAAELLLTARRSGNPAKNLAYWKERFKLIPIIYADARTCEIWADITASLKGLGLTRTDNDLWIAACAIRHDLPLLTNNLKHFQSTPNLNLVPFTPPPLQP